MQETTIVGMNPMQETTNIVANVKDCRKTMSNYMLCNGTGILYMLGLS